MYAVAKPEDFVKDLVPVYKDKIDKMRELINEFNEKTAVGLWWDSKVPEKDKVKDLAQFYKMLFTNINWLGVSDREEVTEEIGKYLTLYKNVAKTAEEISKIMEEKGIDAADSKMEDLKLELKQAIKEAENQKDDVSSTAIYKAHLSLISEQGKVVGKLDSIQLEISRRHERSLTRQLEKSENLSENYRKQFETLQQSNHAVEQKLETLTQKMERMMQNQAPSSSLSEVGTISRSSSIGSDIEFIGRR